MIVCSSPSTAWLLAQFTDEGVRRGWITSIASTSCYSRKAIHFLSRQHAINHILIAEYAWRGYHYLYVAEQVPLDVDSRTWRRRSGGGRDDERLDSDDDMRLRSAACHSAVPAITQRAQRRLGERAKIVNNEATIVAKGDSAFMAIKGSKKTSKPTSKKKAATKATTTATTKPLAKKPVFRTTSKAPFKNSHKEGGVCLCGSVTKGNCGEPAFRFIRRGHGMQRRAALAAIKAGVTTPEKAFGAKIARAMGPWSSVGKKGGLKPATVDYSEIRAAL